MNIQDHHGTQRADGCGKTEPLKPSTKVERVSVVGNRQRGASVWRLGLLLHLIAPFAVASVLWRGEKVEERRATILADRDAEFARIFDSAHGSDRMRSLILHSLKVAPPYVAVTTASEVHVIPASTPWTIRCDDISGISIAFIANAADLSGGPVLQLSGARPNKEQCLDIGLSLAKLLETILAGR
jgi:hypothetical protein